MSYCVSLVCTLCVLSALSGTAAGAEGVHEALEPQSICVRDNEDASRDEAPLLMEGLVIGVDAGHQKVYDPTPESIAPGSAVTRAKVAGGTYGRFTGVYEYEVNLKVALKLKKLLENNGARVVMTREVNEVNISNSERAKLFNDNNVDVGIRLHCNGSKDSTKSGAFVCVPSNGAHVRESRVCGQCVLDGFLRETGAHSFGIVPRGDLSGFNWCTRPVILIEMGHMTNKAEDIALASDEYEDKMAMGIFKGFVEYFTDEEIQRG